MLELGADSQDFCLSFSLPFDADGEAAGAPRLVLETRTEGVWQRVFEADLAEDLIAEAEDEIATFLDRPIASEVLLGGCRPDNRIWQEKMLRLARTEVDRIRQAGGK